MPRIAYLDCHSGISGDMTLAALVDAGVSLEAIQDGVASLGLPEVRLVTEEVKRHGFRATALRVEHPLEHAHRHLHHITDMIDAGRLSERQKELAKRIFTRLGEAEAKVHGTTLRKVHFHEVGAVDSIADVVGAAIGWDLLGVERVVCSPIPTGVGEIEIAHGRCSLPAPATAELLSGVPLASSNIAAELTTPTGAAIAVTLAQSFGPVPPMRIEKIGYGAGSRDLAEQPNILRLLVGVSDADDASDEVWVLETNLDDVTGETIGYCTVQLLEAGALDVYTTAIQMKKNRPGVKLTVLAGESDVGRFEEILFRETSTLGVRRWRAARHKLSRRPHEVSTRFGVVSGKLGGSTETTNFSPEFESCSRLAAQHRVPLREVYDAALEAFRAQSPR